MQQDRDDDTDDDDNLILDGAAEQELNNKQKPSSEVEKPSNSEELEAIKSQLKSSPAINVNKDKKNDWDI